MGKVNIFVDPGAAITRQKLWDLAEGSMRPIVDSLDTTSALTQIGRDQLAKFQAGDVGSTIFGNAVRSDAARQKKTLDESYGLASRARQVAGPGVNSDLVYKRMLDREKSRIDDAASDRVAGNLPAWMLASGQMEQADNQLKMNKLQGLGEVGQTIGAGWNAQASGTQYTQKKGFLDTLGQVVGIAGGIMALSDERAKDIEGDVDPNESKNVIRQLGAKSYAYKPEFDPEQKPQVGEVAQDVEAVAPEAVGTRPDGLKEVDFKPLIAHTMNALKAVMQEQDEMRDEWEQFKQLLQQRMATSPAPVPAMAM